MDLFRLIFVRLFKTRTTSPFTMIPARITVLLVVPVFGWVWCNSRCCYLVRFTVVVSVVSPVVELASAVVEEPSDVVVAAVVKRSRLSRCCSCSCRNGLLTQVVVPHVVETCRLQL